MRAHDLVPAMAAYLALSCLSCHRFPQPQRTARRVLYYHDPMHPSYRSDRPGIAPDCKMPLTPVYAGEDTAKPGLVRVDAAQASAIGLRTEAAREEAVSVEVRTVGRVQAQESRSYEVTAGADGWIREVRGGETGSFVAKGQALASYYSRDIASPQQAYLYALDSLRRVSSSPTGVQEQRDLAAKQVRQARDYLEFLGMTGSQIAELESRRQESREITLGAPAAGVVLARNVSEGARFAKGDVLWEIANIDSVWIAVDLFPEDLASISGARTGAIILPNGSEAEAVVDSSLPRFETADRVAKLRLTLPNTGRKLLPGMTVTVRLHKALGKGLTVPADSVIEAGISPRVFVDRGDGSYEARPVATGWRSRDRCQILSGLRPDEQVVVAGAFLIDSESRINENLK